MQRRSFPVLPDTNGVPLEDGRTHHVGVAKGEVANRIVLVGSSHRRDVVPTLDGAPQFSIKSHRVSKRTRAPFRHARVIVTTGMGGPMMTLRSVSCATSSTEISRWCGSGAAGAESRAVLAPSRLTPRERPDRGI